MAGLQGNFAFKFEATTHKILSDNLSEPTSPKLFPGVPPFLLKKGSPAVPNLSPLAQPTNAGPYAKLATQIHPVSPDDLASKKASIPLPNPSTVYPLSDKDKLQTQFAAPAINPVWMAAAKVMVVTSYLPVRPDEITLEVGDIVIVETRFHDGWAKGVNLSNEQIGMFPLHHTKDLPAFARTRTPSIRSVPESDPKAGYAQTKFVQQVYAPRRDDTAYDELDQMSNGGRVVPTH
ncbi:uncharacterized protein BJ171DRAFT_576398 [Polychytrium aggregatum]|uniref:uncharacterized protein n=1 Tax=Polychytrium aggregatum TaxID=110093 RepID=UPI0022FDC406|nr:uncharacterized protein BJ171DRAFT_576398 [Polychytrium aggregatum]KAI9209609.1 hypothetical protein BJ171DRAFT_576398 [Polychytrium aggregatum]